MYIFKIFKSFIKNYKFTILFYIIFTLLSFPLEAVIVPQIYSNFFDKLTKKTDKEVYIKYFLGIIIVLIIINTANCLTTYIESYMIPDLNSYVINYIFSNLLLKYENNMEDIEIGKIITRINTIPVYLKEFIQSMCVWVIPRFFALVIINIYFFYLNPYLGIISVLLVLIYYYVNKFFFEKCKKISQEKHHLFEKKSQDTQDKLSNSFSIYSNGYVNNEILNYDFKTSGYTEKFKENLFCYNKLYISNSILNIFLFGVLNFTAVYLYFIKKIDFVNLMAIFITIIYYIPCIITIYSCIPELVTYYGTLKSIDYFIEDLYNVELKHKNKNNQIKVKSKINTGKISIINLSFGYNNHILFNDLNLTINKNEKIAIIGKSGNGKSTLIKLIMGYYKVPDNTIFIDNIDLNNFNLNSLRTQISYVNQNTKLFNLTLLENIQYGNNLSKLEIINLCNRLNVNNVFKNLKNGFNTNVGIEGNNLSGGQKQLVHILRAIGKKNKIVILDEPTSAIDKDNKQNVINAIKEVSKNNTLILITHDHSLLNIVDRVVTIDAGKIINDYYNS